MNTRSSWANNDDNTNNNASGLANILSQIVAKPNARRPNDGEEIRMIVTSSNPTTLQVTVGLAYHLTKDVVRSGGAPKGEDGRWKRQDDHQRNCPNGDENRGRKPACYECGSLDHLRNVCTRLNRDPNNAARNQGAPAHGRVHVIEAEEVRQDLNVKKCKNQGIVIVL
ncbi:hypothetical protein Tco_0855477 [Tanacetum coccineum]